jgi:phage/plasmid-associated DNA primase
MPSAPPAIRLVNTMLGLTPERKPGTTLHGFHTDCYWSEKKQQMVERTTHVADGRNEKIDRVLDGNDPLFEHIWAPDPTTATHKPYFDVDWNTTSEAAYHTAIANGTVLHDAVTHLSAVLPDVDHDLLRISSYNGRETSKRAAKKKQGAYIISYHIVIEGMTCTHAENLVAAEQLHTQYAPFDTSVYKPNQLFRVAGHHKQPRSTFNAIEFGINRTPRLLHRNPASGEWAEFDAKKDKMMGHTTRASFVHSHLINPVEPEYVPLRIDVAASVPEIETTPMPTPEPAPTLTPTPTPNQVPSPPPTPTVATPLNQELWQMLQRLPAAMCTDHKLWFRVTLLCRALAEGTPATNRAAWDAWSLTQPQHYDRVRNAKTWESITAAKRAEVVAPLRQLRKLVAEHELPPAAMQELHGIILDGTDETIVDSLARRFGRFWAVPDPSTERGECYMYDERDCLWKSYHRSTFHDFMRLHFTPLCNAYKARVNDHPHEFFKAPPLEAGATDEADAGERKKAAAASAKAKVAAINKTLRTIKSTRAKNAYQKGFFIHERVIDTTFERKLNATPHYLSVRNGLIDLRDGSLIPRRYDHYISQCLDLDYDPETAPTANAPWCKFVRDIFDAPELKGGAEVVAFLQSFLGFCLTGHGAQECCIAVGCGSNGKSLLQNAMACVLRTVTASRYMNNWSSKVFDEAANRESSNQATPELAKLEGVRLAVINETAASQSWGEAWKKLVDDTAELSVRQLHCKPKIIRNTAKWLINTNHMPEVPTDACYVRRMMILPMLMRFVDAPDSSDPHQRLRDTELQEAMVGTEEARQGVLSWMVEGAKGYYARGRKVLPSPPCCRRYKDDYVASNEWTTLFVCGKDNGLTKADHMSYNDIKTAIRGLIDRRVPTNEVKKKLEELGAQEKKVLVQAYEPQGYGHPAPPQQRKQMVCFIRLAQGDDSDDE